MRIIETSLLPGEQADKFREMETSSDFPSLVEEDSFSRRMLQTGLLVDKYYTPLLCLLGAFGNSLSLLVFCMDAKYRRQSSSYYLSALAISDSGFLLNLFAVWLESVMGGVITSHLTCPLVMYLGQVTCFMSVYLTVGFSLERYIAVNFPFSRPRICTRSKAKKVIAAVVTTALLVFSYAWFIAKVIEIPASSSSASPKCVNLEEGQRMMMANNENGSVEWIDEQNNADSQEVLFLEQMKNFSNPFCNETVEMSNPHKAPMYMCTVPERFYKISEIANYLDSGITLIIPFLLITYFNVCIARSVWRLRGQRQHIVASLASTLNQTMILTTVAESPQNKNHRQNSNRVERSSIKVVRNPLGENEKNGNAENINAQPKRINGSLYRQSVPSGRENIYKQNSSLVALQHQQQRLKVNATYSGPYQQQTPQQQQQPPSSEMRVTKTLLLVSTTFVVLNLPLHAIRCTQFIQTATGTPEGQDFLQALQPWANMLFNTNFAVNLLLYCVSGSNFRKSLRNIAARVIKKRRPNLEQRQEHQSLRRK